MNLQLSNIQTYSADLHNIPNKKLLINTINAHSYNIAQEDEHFAKALHSSDLLLPDGISIVIALRLFYKKRIRKIAGADLFYYEMERLNQLGGKCFFLGSNNDTLKKIEHRIKEKYANIQVKTYSPPYVDEFSKSDNQKMVSAVNQFEPDVLFIGMTAPKQEKWAYNHFENINAKHICSIGAVFDFFAGTVKRAPNWMIKLGLEWFFRLLMEPRRMWRRYILGNFKFIYFVIKEKFVRN